LPQQIQGIYWKTNQTFDSWNTFKELADTLEEGEENVSIEIDSGSLVSLFVCLFVCLFAFSRFLIYAFQLQIERGGHVLVLYN
jgi:hypothetical protein